MSCHSFSFFALFFYSPYFLLNLVAEIQKKKHVIDIKDEEVALSFYNETQQGGVYREYLEHAQLCIY